MIQVTDTLLTAGAIALDVSNQPIEFDDVLVTQIGSGDPPPPAEDDNGPGGPVLVISRAANPFTRYAGEILLAEGLNGYAIREISTVTSTVLADYDVVVLGETPLTSAQVTMLTDWVNAGGNLIALRPDPQLAGLLGLTAVGSTLANGYLLIDTTAAPGGSSADDPVPRHGRSLHPERRHRDRHPLLERRPRRPPTPPSPCVASAPRADRRRPSPTTSRARSSTPGRAIRPGPARSATASRRRRSDDLFFGAAAGDPQTDWVDLDKVAIPQADEQQRLLANLILTHERRPEAAAALLVSPARSQGGGRDDRRRPRQQRHPGALRQRMRRRARPAARWRTGSACGRLPTSIPARRWRRRMPRPTQPQGFEIGVHVSTDCGDWTPPRSRASS